MNSKRKSIDRILEEKRKEDIMKEEQNRILHNYIKSKSKSKRQKKMIESSFREKEKQLKKYDFDANITVKVSQSKLNKGKQSFFKSKKKSRPEITKLKDETGTVFQLGKEFESVRTISNQNNFMSDKLVSSLKNQEHHNKINEPDNFNGKKSFKKTSENNEKFWRSVFYPSGNARVHSAGPGGKFSKDLILTLSPKNLQETGNMNSTQGQTAYEAKALSVKHTVKNKPNLSEFYTFDGSNVNFDAENPYRMTLADYLNRKSDHSNKVIKTILSDANNNGYRSIVPRQE